MVDFDSINKSAALFNWPTEDLDQENMYEWAIHYLDLGWNIMPIESSGKKPRLWKWEQFQNERVTPDLAEEWWDRSWPLANIALICGQISDVVVLDIDDSGKCNLAISSGALPMTAMSQTARGYHYFFRYPKGGRFPSFKGEGFDMQSDGKYVILPPSIHPSGAIYTWKIDPWHELEPFAELPQILLELGGTSDKEVDHRGGEVKPLINMDGYFDGVGEGGRNNAAARLAGYLFNNDREYDEVCCTLIGWNLKNRPPLPHRELMTVLDSVFKKHFNGKYEPK